jgi:hypothetical protein
MRYSRLLPVIFFSLCFAAAAHAQQSQVCTLNVEHAPELRGFRLGMTADQVKARVPGIQINKQEFGASFANLASVDFHSLDAVAYRGINDISFSFLDDRLVRFTVNYQSVPWKTAGQFAAKVSESLKLPDAWRDGGNFSEVLTCAGFDVIANANTNTITLNKPGYNEIVKERREQRDEKLRQDFRP